MKLEELTVAFVSEINNLDVKLKNYISSIGKQKQSYDKE